MILGTLYALAGALWRVVDGSSKAPLKWHLVPLALVWVALVVFGWQVALMSAIGYVSLLDGFKDWKDYGYMSMRYTGYAGLSLAAVFGLSYLFGSDLCMSALWYVPLACVAGMLYPVLNTLHERGMRLPKFWLFNGYNTYAEFVCGAVMIGSPVFLI